MHGEDAMNPRTCILSRLQKTPDEMIRFVLDPQNRVVADIKCQLPGRGVWVTANRKMVDEAVRRKLFARSFRKEVATEENLGEQTDRLLCSAALGALGMARKAGLVVSGHTKANQAIRSARAVVLIHASGAADDGVRKLEAALSAAKAMGGAEIVTSRIWSGEELDGALGGSNLVHVAVLPGGAALKLMAWLEKIKSYREPG